MLDLYKLHIFTIVKQEGSFSAAAERLFMTQSAISQHIKELEANLGRQLFQRGWRGVRLTPHGEILGQYADDIFALIAKAEAALTDVDQLQEGRISIGATPGISSYLAPHWVQQFRTRYPKLSVSSQTGVTSQIVADMLGQKLDIGFIEGELDDYQAPRLSSLVLEEIEQIVVMGFRHPFYETESVSVEDLHDQPFIVRESTSQTRHWLEDTMDAHGIELKIGAEFDNLESIKRTVSIGTCLAVLPPYVVQTEIEQGLLHAIKIDEKPFSRSLKLIWDKNTHFSPVARAFLDEMARQYPSINELLNKMEK